MLRMQSPSWQEKLAAEFQKNYYQQLEQNVDQAYNNNSCYPPRNQIFAAFDACALQDIKVVILGQDPYHGAGEAHGFAFSVPDGVRIPPSLHNIFRELAADLDRIMLPTNGNLTYWASQGVFLLNATLSVEKDKPNSHAKMGWQEFTAAVIQLLSDEKENLVFLLWGNFAQQKGKLINRKKHLVLEAGHPSPMSANQGKWFGNKHFSQANAYLLQHQKTPIEW